MSRAVGRGPVWRNREVLEHQNIPGISRCSCVELMRISCTLLFRDSLPFKIQPKSRWFGLVGLGHHCYKEAPALFSETSACAQERMQILWLQHSLCLIFDLILFGKPECFLLAPTENILVYLKYSICVLQEWWGGKDVEGGIFVHFC